MGSEGGALGPRHSLWVVVVGTQCVFVMLVHHSQVHTTVHGGGHSTCLCHSFPGMMWPPTGRGGVMWRVLAANCQWAVDGDGAVLVGWVVIDMVDVARLTCGVIRGSGAVECSFRGCWSSCAGCCLCYVWLSLLLGSVVVIRWVVAVICWAVVVVWWLGLFAVVGVA